MVEPSRPQVKHGVSSPDLVGKMTADVPRINVTGSAMDGSVDDNNKHGGNPENHDPDGEGRTAAERLLQKLITRLNEDYKTVVFEIPDVQKDTARYGQRVSFDTINIQAVEDPSLDFLDDEAKAEYLARRRLLADLLDGRGRSSDRDYLSIKSPGTSPPGSPTRMRSPLRGKDLSALFGRGQIPYPTVPILTRKCCTLTRIHKDFEDLYLGKLAHKGLWPMLPGRVIMVYISGRKHTWVAIDWILRNFVQDGDAVVVVASIPHALASSNTGLTRYPPPLSYPPKTERVRQRQRMRPEYIKLIASNIMTYCQSVANPNAIVKLTVEIAEGKTKEVLKDMYKLYEPNIVSTGSKASTKNYAPLKSWHSARLSDRLVKLFPLPVIVVPATNMGPFEEKLSLAISNNTSTSSSGNTSNLLKLNSIRSATKSHKSQNDDDNDSDVGSLSDHSFQSQSSTNSESLEDSYTSFDEIADLYNGYKDSVNSKLEKLRKGELNENYFANFIKAISDESLRFCQELKDVDPDFKGQGAKLAREITGSNSFGAVPYKTKSLLPPIEKGTTGGSTSGVSYSELKRNLKNNAMKANLAAGAPSIKIDAPSSPTTAPKALSLKFADGEKPHPRAKMSKLQKFLSHEDLSNRKVDLSPSKSQPDLTQTFQPDEKKGKKKKKFWKLFGGSS